MPYLGPFSAPALCDEYLQHWATVNATLGLSPLQIIVDPALAPHPRGDLTSLKFSFETFMTGVQGYRDDLELSTADAATARELLSPLITAFNRKVRGTLGHTSFPKALPESVSPSMGNPAMLKSGDDMTSLWGKINALVGGPAFTPPLLVPLEQPGSTTVLQITLAQALTRVVTLRNAVQGISGAGGIANAEQNLQLRRGDRNRFWEMEIRPLLSAYRDRILGDYPADHPFVVSLPRLYPASTGTTPDPVTASAQWVNPPGEAVITHESGRGAL